MGTSGSATYTYDLFNRQKTHTSGGVVTTTTYRPDGLRHSIGGTKHIWDGQNIVGEYVGSTYKKYFRALTLIYRLASNTKQWYNTNGHGDVIALTNAAGTVVKTYTYNAFGEEQDISTTDGNPFRYCGEYYDTACGTLYLRARNYDATTGRFTQQDGWEYGDISEPLSLNLYIYGWNSPINGIDPSGHLFGWLKKAIEVAVIAVTTIAVVAAVVATAGAAAAAVGVAAGMMATSLGASAATVATVTAVTTTVATVGCYAVAATDALIGISDAVEVATDGYNPIRDSVLGGSQETYDTIKFGTNLLSAGIVDVGSKNSFYQDDSNDEIEDDVNVAKENTSETEEKYYYQVTSNEAAEKIEQTGKLIPSDVEGSVCVLDSQPTVSEASMLGARSMETVIKFQTNCTTFVRDTTVLLNIRAYRNSIPGPINVYNISKVGFK